jgi:hypothetical protein
MTWNDRDDFDQSRADHQMLVEMTTPLDDTHAASVEARILVRQEFAAVRRRIAMWEPAPCPPRVLRDVRLLSVSLVPAPLNPEWTVQRVYLDEVARNRPWFRS